MIYVRGNSPEEHAAEQDRLRQAGLASDNDWFIFEPRGAGEISSKIVEISHAALRQILREIDDGKHGKIIRDEGAVDNTGSMSELREDAHSPKEHCLLTFNQVVAGSSPAALTKNA
jgi:hypothetical protein